MHISIRPTPGRLAVTVMAVGLPLAVLAAPVTAHAAVNPTPQPCDRNSCSGLDPTLSYEVGSNPKAFCADGAYTAYQVQALGGTLELRWGPNCQTNWIRFTPSDNDTYEMGLYGTDANGNFTAFAGDGLNNTYTFKGASYSDQVWSPGPADPCIADDTVGTGLICFPQPG